MQAAISIYKLTKKFPRRGKDIVAVQELDLEVHSGEAFGFIGQNGAGKSTTIKILTGSIRASSGTAMLFGTATTEAKARLNVGYVPENPYLLDYLTPLETLEMGCKLHNQSGQGLKKKCMGWLERFGIAHVAHARIRSFSKGMTQRTALAHALAVNPRLLILDEPLSGLDPIGRKDVVDILMEYRKQGGTIFFSSHVLYDVERLADRFGLIHKGELKTVQSPHELLGDEQRFVVRTIGEQLVEGLEQDVGNRWFTEVGQVELWALLHKLEAAHHQVIEVKPSLNLESAFMKYVKADPISSATEG
ncbi:ABC transporter ATP-binding protein [Chitiniphilus shinanonensis]|uniref:ABC transporter ATP-binding protein n=1 Tax=Chitiniphilus shinanonensis TaxID=553088 RepID=A0ABQ6BQW4_9NEIS|nr:ABC transporter ATP-binding protein [Chitiniphilus shinanonensis]GLS04049.1 ABC transporter ATP-binding protein [Chitiniphilus shinanonensis]